MQLETPPMSGRGVIHLSLRYHATKPISVIFIHGVGTSDDWIGELRLSHAMQDTQKRWN
jgi:hypothetical protein